MQNRRTAPSSSSSGANPPLEETQKDEPLDPKSLPEGEPEIEIESLIIPAVKELHGEYVESFDRERRGRSGTPGTPTLGATGA